MLGGYWFADNARFTRIAVHKNGYDDIKEITDWLVENVGRGNFLITSSYNPVVRFKNDADAVLFALKWGAQ